MSGPEIEKCERTPWKPERKKKPMNALEIIKEHLEQNGFDGLFDDGNACHCGPEELGDCGEMNEDCLSGYKILYGCDEHDFYIGPEKEDK